MTDLEQRIQSVINRARVPSRAAAEVLADLAADYVIVDKTRWERVIEATDAAHAALGRLGYWHLPRLHDLPCRCPNCEAWDATKQLADLARDAPGGTDGDA